MQLLSELSERDFAKLCYMFESEPDLNMHVQDVGCPSSESGAQNCLILPFFGDFASRDLA